MGFNRRKMEDQRRQAAEKAAAGRRATDAQVLEDAERLIGARGTPGQANADVVLADDRRRHRRGILVSMGPLPSLSHHKRDRSAHARFTAMLP